MRYGVFSDVHGNLPALQATLAALQRLGVDRYVCAGDVVGYGPHPAECIERIAELGPAWVLGNHELMLLGRMPLSSVAPLVRRTLEWTRTVLPSALIERLDALPTLAEAGDGIVVTHGSLSGASLRVRHHSQVVAELQQLRRDHPAARVLVLGHTHHVTVAGPEACARWLSLRRRIALQPGRPYVLNPGSVGQSRGLLNLAQAAVLDTAADTIQLVRVRYDTSTVARDLARAGFPSWLFHRSPARRWIERVRRRLRESVAGADARIARRPH